MVSIELFQFVTLGALVAAIALPILKREDKITLSRGAVAIAEAIILAIGYFAYSMFHQMVASV